MEKYHTVEIVQNLIKKYHTVGNSSKSNRKIPHCRNSSKSYRKIIGRGKGDTLSTQIYDWSLEP